MDVKNITKQNYHRYFNIINPKSLPRSRYEYHLDHVYSISEGFNNNIPPEVIAHPSNLRLVWFSENVRKNKDCGKTVEQLLEDYKNFQSVQTQDR